MKDIKNTIKIVFVIIATLVGAGFASGKEIYSFFFIYQKFGILGICISSTVISLVIHKVFKICLNSNVNTYKEFCEYIGNSLKNKLLNKHTKKTNIPEVLNYIVNIFLIITFYIMISGFSSFLQQEFCINKIVGSLIIICLCYFVFLKNINGLIKISNFLIPILIVFFIYISMKNNILLNTSKLSNTLFLLSTADIFATQINSISTAYSTNITPYIAIFKSILYSCYNCIILIPVLIPLKNFIGNRKNSFVCSIVTCILLIILSFAIYNLLLQGNSQIFGLEMPIIEIVKQYGSLYQYSYIIMIGISIFTTAISAGCGFLNNCSKNKKSFNKNLSIMCFLGIFLSQISFSLLVNLLYPILGIIGLFEIILLIITT